MASTFAEINLRNIERNFLNLKRSAGKARILAVVKADAYGHGMIPVVNYLMNLPLNGPDYYGVANLEEAIEIRKMTRLKKPVLSFAPFQIEDVKSYIDFNIMPSISDEENALRLAGLNLRKYLRVHLNVDTGMGLTGIQHYKAFDIIKNLSIKKNIIIDGIYTIFAEAYSKNKNFSVIQIKRFTSLLKDLKSAGIDYGIVHAANSAAIQNLPESYFDMVRCGSSLYGFYPSKESEKRVKIYPALSLFSIVSVTKKLKKGESVGFGRGFTASKDTNIFTVPIGYADGFKRAFSNNFKALVKGKFYEQIGNVSMDRIAFNAGNDKIIRGEKVVLIGKSRNKEITVWDWADWLSTIPYEVTSTLGQRILRVYKD